MKNGLIVNNKDKSKKWYVNDILHREDGPAIITSYGTKVWLIDGLIHRHDSPAIECANGDEEWYLMGEKHRAGSPAVVAFKHNEWFLHGKELVHPKEFSTTKEWFKFLNDNEKESYKLIHSIRDFISFIDTPSAAQTRLHKMKWVL